MVMSLRTLASMALLLLALLARAGVVDAFRADTRGQGAVAALLARQALLHAVRTHAPLPLPKDLPPLLKQRGAAFVSTMDPRTGAPRCCMGTLLPREATLAQEIVANATAAALYDKRFPPLTPADAARLCVIVSIVGDALPVDDPSILDPAVDGLAVRGPHETGVVLPGETADRQKMLAWGRIRARAAADTPVSYLRLDAIRFLDISPAKESRQ
jgi:AMMECR1 domain-containing protein